jgi:hypothetical protein
MCTGARQKEKAGWYGRQEGNSVQSIKQIILEEVLEAAAGNDWFRKYVAELKKRAEAERKPEDEDKREAA